MQKRKSKIVAMEHGGLMLATAQVNPGVAARHNELLDPKLTGGAAQSLEDFSAHLESIAGMTNLFDGGSFFDQPKGDVPAKPGKDASAAAVDAVTEQAGAGFLAGSDEDEGGPVVIGGLNEADVDSVEEPVIAAELNVAGTQVSPQMDDFSDIDDITWDPAPEVEADASHIPAARDDMPVFDTIGDDEAQINEQISEKIIEFNEIANIEGEIDEGDTDSFMSADMPEDLPEDLLESLSYGDLETDVADQEFDMTGQEPVADESWPEESDLAAILPSAAEEAHPDGEGAIQDQDFEHDPDAYEAPVEDEAQFDIPAGGDEPQEEWDFPESIEALAASQAEPERDDSLDVMDDIMGAAQASDPSQDEIDEWALMGNTDAVAHDPVEYLDDAYDLLGDDEGIKPVDTGRSAVSDFDLSDDTEQAPVNFSGSENFEGDFGVTDADTISSSQGGDPDDFSAFTADDAYEQGPGLEGSTVGADLDNDDADIDAEEPKKKSPSKAIFYAASVAVAAIFAGGSYVALKPFLADQTTAPAVIASPGPTDAPTAIAGPVQAEDAAPASSQDPVISDDGSIDLATPAGADDLFSDGDITDLAMGPDTGPAAPVTPVIGDTFEQDRLARIAAGLEAASTGGIDDLFLTDAASSATAVTPPAPEVDLDAILADYVKADVTEAFRSEMDGIQSAINSLRTEIEAKDERIVDLQVNLDEAQAQAARAEQLALAQNEVLVEMVRLKDKVDMAESLIVDLSRRTASMETTDPADRVAVERSLEQLDSRVKGLVRDVGLIARVAINGSPVTPSSASAAGQAVGAGGDTVFASGTGTKRPAGSDMNVPDDAKKGDLVEGYGYVLDVIPTSDGSKLIVMENGSVLK